VSFLDRVHERARRAGRRILLPEGDDARVQEAARRLRDGRLGSVELLRGVRRDPRLSACASLLCERRPDRFATTAAAATALEHPLTFGACLVALGAADVMVGGVAHPSADTIRAALWAVGTAPGIALVSGAMYMVRDERVLTFADCAVMPVPTPPQLSPGGLGAACRRRGLVGGEPGGAFLSYSTKGSAAGPRVARVEEAVAALARRRPDFAFDGELQGDAALVREVAARKAPGSTAAGRANVLIFPDLDSGNIAYKLVQRLGDWSALGPLLQGLARPIADLSRGATADDIVNTAVVAILQGEEQA
jgi:phosphate acetyltransferase